MSNSPADSDGSHDSGDEHERENDAHDAANPSSKNPAVKDKECQYCHQKFTSSSLGRHLDQFISKKKPDGIHDVDEIRRLRGGITRRTARNNHKKEQDDDDQQTQARPPAHAQTQPQVPPSVPALSTQVGEQSPSLQYSLPSYSELVNKTASREDIRFNRANWQATGVITDPVNVTPAPMVAPSPVMPSPSSNVAAGQKRSYSAYAADLPAGPNGETVRALELSLREVLDAVRVATKKAAPPSKPFDFDFESQTFPFLCLAMLQAPPTLFQMTPFATPTTIPLAAPGADQYQTLRKAINYAVDTWRWQACGYLQRMGSTTGTSLSEELDNITDRAQVYTDSANAHLDAAYQHYMSYPVESRQELWVVELLRGFKTEQDKTKDAKATIDRMTQEATQLQQQLDHLSRCQWPREMALWPPERPTFDSSTQNELRKLNLLRGTTTSTPSTPSNYDGGNQNDNGDDASRRHDDRWDYDRLLSKWRRHVREDRARRTGVQPNVMLQPGQPPPPPPSQQSSADHTLSTSSVPPMSHSPKSMPSSTPRIPSSLHKSATVPDYSSLAPRPATSMSYHPTTTTTHNSYPHSAIEDSPRNSVNASTTPGTGSSTPNGYVSGLGSGSGPATAPASTTSTTNPSASTIYGSGPVPAPPRSRPLGIVSDADEYYAPRLMGFRREPLR